MSEKVRQLLKTRKQRELEKLKLKDGAAGKSAYQIWLDAGHEGTEADFLQWLRGSDGETKTIVEKVDGNDGVDGVGVANIKKTLTNELLFKLTDGRNVNVGQLPKGEKGDTIQGQDGIGVESLSINDKYELIVKLTDGKIINAGKLPEGRQVISGGGGGAKKYVDQQLQNYILKSLFENKGDILVYNGTDVQVLPAPATNGLSLTSNSFTDTGLLWAQIGDIVVDDLLLENGDNRLLEDGSKRLLG